MGSIIPSSLLHGPGIVLLAMMVISLLVLTGYHLFFHLRLARYKAQASGLPQPVSVIICAWNEEDNLRDNLPLILEQEHPEFEVIVVNDHSTDETEYLIESWTHAYHNLRLVNLNRENAKVRGKKFAISIGIKGAKYDRMVLTDADCRPRTKHWLRHMSASFGPGKEVVLGYGAYEKKPGFMNRIIRFDTFSIALQYMSFSLAGVPYMGVGRNLAYVRELFFRTKGFIRHRHIQSGDDDLLVNEVANATNTVICPAQEAHTISEPKSTFLSYWVQKRRHLSTGSYYDGRTQFLLGLGSSAWWIFHISLLVLLIVPGALPLALVAYVLRLSAMAGVYLPVMRTLGEADLFLFSPVTDVVSMVFNTAASMSNILMKPTRWR